MGRTLSQDVRRVGDTLGAVLRAHGGDALFAHEERMRLAAKRAREAAGTPEGEAARADLAAAAVELDPAAALEVVRAFTLYFQLVNVAEDVHRTRELRRRELEQGPDAVAESLPQVIDELFGKGATRDETLAALSDIALTFVFTSHPTEARRRTTERLLATVRRRLEELDRRLLTPAEEMDNERSLKATVEALWEHDAERDKPPAVLEEVKAGLWYIRNVALDAVPRLHRRLGDALQRRFGAVDPLELPVPIRFRSWMGSDRDGNPFVTDAVMERTLELHRTIVLERYRSDLDALVDPLAASGRRFPRFAPLEEALERAEAAVPEAVLEARRRNPDEPLRRLLTFMRARIVRSLSFSAGGYPRPDDFLDDLRVLRDALRNAGGIALAEDRLLDLIHRVRCFGFVLAALDVRELSHVHRRVVGELLGDAGYATAGTAERLAALERLRLPPRGASLEGEARRLLDCFATIGRLQARFGPEAMDAYVISMTEGPADVIEVLRLAELHGLANRLDVVPLFETSAALKSCGELLRELLARPGYRAHLEQRDDIQEILVGYSDSMKEAGILSSRERILDAQCAAAEACRTHGVKLRIFHGRGGSVSRGGGPTHRAIRALPRAAMSGQLKITEQGETRAAHFASADLAVRTMEQSLGAVLVVRIEARGGATADGRAGGDALVTLAADSERAYRELVTDEGLLRYFQEASPFAQIARLNIASRPARRAAGGELRFEDLRAIPWVFAWSQSRHVITGWYGVGAALEAFAGDGDGLPRLMELYAESLFFRDLLDNVQMTLAKADLDIAERYASLCADPGVRDRIFGRIRGEHDRTRAMVLRITGQEELLEHDPVVSRSIRLRNPYVDPLSYIQVEALRRLRAATDDATRAAWDRVARSAVHGIAAGLRNTG